jgi:hypothetical protein
MTNTYYYIVTGILTNGRRFKAIHTKSYKHAMGINLYRGSVWERQSDGSRKLLKRVWN